MIGEFEDIIIETTQNETQKTKINKQSHQWAGKQLHMAKNICVIGILEGGGWSKKIFEEITADTFPNLMETINPQIQEAKWTPSRRNMKQTTPNCIIKLLKTSDLERNLKNRMNLIIK